MAILKFYISDDKKMHVKLLKHNFEKDTDATLIWAKYALDLCIQLNFNNIKNNPFAIDQGASIKFLNYDIIKSNGLTVEGEIMGEDEDYPEYEYDIDYDEDDDVFGCTSNFDKIDENFEFADMFEVFNVLENNRDCINILLDQSDAIKVIGGLTTPTATSSTAIHEALKEADKRLKKKK